MGQHSTTVKVVGGLAGIGLAAASIPVLGPTMLMGGLNAAGFSATGPVAGK